MIHRTTPNRPWVLKFVLVASVMIGWGLWHGYDAWIGYPRHNERLESREKNSRLLPEQRPYSRGQILGQWLMMALLWTGAAALLVRLWAAFRWPLGCDETGLHGPWGRRVAYRQIRRIDKSLWDRTGLAKIEYEAEGRRRRMRIAAYVYSGAADVLAEAERRSGLGDEPGD
ncbi:MAG: hypothetical protein R3236_04750 [Phycisphaeraceae bacterium]|nr:hypothetical protein [Phycisphaeraceae bacterium]